MEEKTMSRDYWDGSYESSDEGQQSLEDDILDAGKGKFAYGTIDGGTVKQTDNSINVYYPDSSHSSGHSHQGVSRTGGYYKK